MHFLKLIWCGLVWSFRLFDRINKLFLARRNRFLQFRLEFYPLFDYTQRKKPIIMWLHLNFFFELWNHWSYFTYCCQSFDVVGAEPARPHDIKKVSCNAHISYIQYYIHFWRQCPPPPTYVEDQNYNWGWVGELTVIRNRNGGSFFCLLKWYFDWGGGHVSTATHVKLRRREYGGCLGEQKFTSTIFHAHDTNFFHKIIKFSL